MPKKPLVSYSPNASRSRIWQPLKVTMNRNTSSVSLDGGFNASSEKRRFKTTHNLSYTGLPLDLRGNSGIISEDLKLYRKTLVN